MSDYLRAYQVFWSDITSIVLAATPGQAKAAVLESAKSAGYRPRWNDIRCKRTRQYDVLVLARTMRQCPLAPETADQIKAQIVGKVQP
jgi:hypothetical protein